MTLTRKQVRAIHTLKGALGMDDTAYREVLGSFGAKSSLDLSVDKANDVIELLSARASKAGKWMQHHRPQSALPFEELGNRPGFPSPAQLRMICARWAEVSRVEPGQRRQALENLLSRQYHIEKLEWLPEHLVAKVLKTISAMKKEASSGTDC